MSEWFQRHAPAWLVRVVFRLGFYLGRFYDKWLKPRPKIVKINIVGDLSLQAPERLQKVMDAAAECDILIQVGDMHPCYECVKRAPKGCFAVVGNHDTDWDKNLGWPRQWRHDTPECLIIGIDNSKDTFAQADYDTVQPLPTNKPVFIVVHKPLSTIVLPDGTQSSHSMGEGAPNADAKRMQAIVAQAENVLLVHGHYHGKSVFKTAYADCVVEGRGGAAPILGFTSILVTKDGWTIHQTEL